MAAAAGANALFVPLHDLLKCGERGIDNQWGHNNCFLNSVLQAMYHHRDWRARVLELYKEVVARDSKDAGQSEAQLREGDLLARIATASVHSLSEAAAQRGFVLAAVFAADSDYRSSVAVLPLAKEQHMEKYRHVDCSAVARRCLSGDSAEEHWAALQGELRRIAEEIDRALLTRGRTALILVCAPECAEAGAVLTAMLAHWLLTRAPELTWAQVERHIAKLPGVLGQTRFAPQLEKFAAERAEANEKLALLGRRRRVLAELCRLIHCYDQTHGSSVDPEELRNTMAALVGKYETGRLNDAHECLEFLLKNIDEAWWNAAEAERVAAEAAGDRSQTAGADIKRRRKGGGFWCCRGCMSSLARQYYGMHLVRQTQCRLCKHVQYKTDEHPFFWTMWASELYRAGPEEHDIFCKRVWDTRVETSCERAGANCKGKAPWQCEMKGPPPKVMTFNLTWAARDVPRADIASLCAAVPGRFMLRDAVQGEQVGNKVCVLSGLIFYYGLHYISSFYNREKAIWVVFDDQHLSAAASSIQGLWKYVVNGKILPFLFFYDVVDESDADWRAADELIKRRYEGPVGEPAEPPMETLDGRLNRAELLEWLKTVCKKDITTAELDDHLSVDLDLLRSDPAAVERLFAKPDAPSPKSGPSPAASPRAGAGARSPPRSPKSGRAELGPPHAAPGSGGADRRAGKPPPKVARKRAAAGQDVPKEPNPPPEGRKRQLTFQKHAEGSHAAPLRGDSVVVSHELGPPRPAYGWGMPGTPGRTPGGTPVDAPGTAAAAAASSGTPSQQSAAQQSPAQQSADGALGESLLNDRWMSYITSFEDRDEIYAAWAHLRGHVERAKRERGGGPPARPQ
eukprot:TRINITY_DN5191_c0_g1_i1.p1 TRINITY_DN5191_c0_g1~~TRINITY_DN5191_c0_g1_i1.p1  ORF type:complete len:895 (+),score=273.71 TRINITY_DN5191_c0_g1_i1:126-2687(+)